MPTAELLKPKRLNFLGVIWEKGVVVPVDFDTARELEGNERFKVRGLSGREAVEAEAVTRKPKNRKDLFLAIRDAVDTLDVDDEDNFTASGKPNHLALSVVLGYSVTEKERDAALGVKAEKPVVTDADLEKPSGKTSNLRITRKTPAADAGKDAGAGDGDGGKEDDSDPTTENALEA